MSLLTCPCAIVFFLVPAQASADVALAIAEEYKCMFCMELCTQPTMLSGCTHSFCYACLTEYDSRAIETKCLRCTRVFTKRDWVRDLKGQALIAVLKKR